MMTSADVIAFYSRMKKLGIKIWIDGGWGVDALLGKQTRPHNDLDIFVQQRDVPELRELMEAGGYREIKLEIARPHNFVLGDKEGREIDVHVIVFDDAGSITYGPAENGEIFPIAVLSGIGTINGKTVKCTSPEWMVRWHTGYKPRENDYKDVSALCEKFGLDCPSEYAHQKQNSNVKIQSSK